MNRETLIALLTVMLYLAILISIIRIIFRIIKWIIKGILFIFRGKPGKPDLTQSEDWLTRAQAKQEIRFENSLPPILSEAKPQKKTFREKRREKKGQSPTGWTFNEETQMWDPPKKLRK